MQVNPGDRPPPDHRRGGPHRKPWQSPVLMTLIGLCCAVELTLLAADHGLVGTRLWRPLAYQNGAFWAGLMGNWQPNYPAQPWLMFVTYAFLHAGPGHLAGNMLTLLFLGEIAEQRAGRTGLLAIYAVSAVGGGLAFGLLSNSPQPMVGASGALFGLAGAWQAWEWQDRRLAGQSLRPVLGIVAGFGLLNLLIWWAMDGQLAWETHLGGFVAGWTVAMLPPFALRRKRRGG